jgi:ABC-2 type transport system permease protein/lipopolysaccharide transport system permease protein
MTPVIYAPQNVNSSIVRAIANYGPTGSYIVAIHEIMYDLRFPSVGRMAYLVALAFGVFFAGAWVFNRLSPKFAEEM